MLGSCICDRQRLPPLNVLNYIAFPVRTFFTFAVFPSLYLNHFSDVNYTELCCTSTRQIYTQFSKPEEAHMIEHEIIEPSQSSWSSPIVMVPKPDGTLRFCIEYRKVNAETKTDSYPIPRLEDCIDRVGNSAFVSKIDLLKGYWQVPLTDRAKEISAFVTPDGLYQCKTMPLGMKNAPATFQRMMSQVIAGLENCVVYIDDILVYSDSWEDHLKHMSVLFDKLSKANLVLNLKKSEFAKATVTYLGHVVGQGHVLPRVAKVQAIQEFPVPTGKRELMRFLGMSGFYRKFVPNFSTIATPLTKLLQNNVKFVWTRAKSI